MSEIGLVLTLEILEHTLPIIFPYYSSSSSSQYLCTEDAVCGTTGNNQPRHLGKLELIVGMVTVAGLPTVTEKSPLSVKVGSLIFPPHYRSKIRIGM